jgi:hypothetical protein
MTSLVARLSKLKPEDEFRIKMTDDVRHNVPKLAHTHTQIMA